MPNGRSGVSRIGLLQEPRGLCRAGWRLDDPDHNPHVGRLPIAHEVLQGASVGFFGPSVNRPERA